MLPAVTTFADHISQQGSKNEILSFKSNVSSTSASSDTDNSEDSDSSSIFDSTGKDYQVSFNTFLSWKLQKTLKIFDIHLAYLLSGDPKPYFWQGMNCLSLLISRLKDYISVTNYS